MTKRLLNNDWKYILFSELYHRLEEPKSKRRAFILLEAAIACFARKGFEAVTLEMIAREAGVTRPLLRHYFRDIDDIHETAIKYIRLLFQKVAVVALAKGKNPDDALSLYVQSCFDWVANSKTHAKVWLAFIYRCSQHKVSRELNTAAVRVGEERIIQVLELGLHRGFFNCNNSRVAARLIQTLVTGALVSVGSENVSPDYTEMIKKQCLVIAGIRELSPKFSDLSANASKFL